MLPEAVSHSLIPSFPHSLIPSFPHPRIPASPHPRIPAPHFKMQHPRAQSNQIGSELASNIFRLDVCTESADRESSHV
jgi:hypothetical protein